MTVYTVSDVGLRFAGGSGLLSGVPGRRRRRNAGDNRRWVDDRCERRRERRGRTLRHAGVVRQLKALGVLTDGRFEGPFDIEPDLGHGKLKAVLFVQKAVADRFWVHCEFNRKDCEPDLVRAGSPVFRSQITRS